MSAGYFDRRNTGAGQFQASPNKGGSKVQKGLLQSNYSDAGKERTPLSVASVCVSRRRPRGRRDASSAVF